MIQLHRYYKLYIIRKEDSEIKCPHQCHTAGALKNPHLNSYNEEFLLYEPVFNF